MSCDWPSNSVSARCTECKQRDVGKHQSAVPGLTLIFTHVNNIEQRHIDRPSANQGSGHLELPNEGMLSPGCWSANCYAIVYQILYFLDFYFTKLIAFQYLTNRKRVSVHISPCVHRICTALYNQA